MRSSSSERPTGATAVADVAAAHRVAAGLSARLRLGDVVGLYGDLGAGKTTFVRGLYSAMGGVAEAITSPTFSLIEAHPLADGLLVHADLYRLEDAEEARATGLFDYLGAPDCIVAVEWPEVIGAALMPSWKVTLGGASGESGRWIRIERVG